MVSDLENRSWIEKPLLVLGLMFVCSAILLRANYNQPFYNFDDEEHFRQATATPVNALLFKFNTNYTYLPVSALSLRLDRKLFGPPWSAHETVNSDGGYVADTGVRNAANLNYFGDKNWAPFVRIENGIFHALAGFLLWLFLRRLKVGSGLALFVALMWSVHPMACESVCWISERKNVLAAMFGFAALWVQSFRGWAWRWPMTSLLFLLATLSKPTGVGFLPAIVAFEFLTVADGKSRFDFSREKLRSAAGLIGPVVVMLGIVWIGLNSHKQFFVKHPGGSLFTALLTDVEIFRRYVLNVIAPVNLSFFYGVEPITSLSDARLWISGALMAAMGVALFAAAKRENWAVVALGLLWFFGALGPTANIAPIPYWMQDRYAYFAAPGLLLAFGLAAQGVFVRLKAERFARIAGGVFAGVIAVLALARSPLFADAYRLVSDAAVRQPMAGMARLTNGRNYFVRVSNNSNPAYASSGAKLADTKIALAEFEAAMGCPDINNFCDVYELRITCAEMMAGVQMDAEARAYLKDWLPPAHLEMLGAGQAYTAADQGRKYKPQTLAYAWLIMAVTRHNEALRAEKDATAINLQALADVERSIQTHVWAYQAFILKARILHFQSHLDFENKDRVGAFARFSEARKTLEMIPVTAEFGSLAAEMLGGMKGPGK